MRDHMLCVWFHSYLLPGQLVRRGKPGVPGTFISKLSVKWAWLHLIRLLLQHFLHSYLHCLSFKMLDFFSPCTLLAQSFFRCIFMTFYYLPITNYCRLVSIGPLKGSSRIPCCWETCETLKWKVQKSFDSTWRKQHSLFGLKCCVKWCWLFIQIL